MHPLYPRSLGVGPCISRSPTPEPAVSIAMATAFLGQQPPVRIYGTYARLSSAAFRRLAILVLVGWAIRTALSSYGEPVHLISPFGFSSPESESASADGFVIAQQESNTSITAVEYEYRKGGEGGEQDSLVNISGQTANALVDMSPGIGSNIFGPLLDISGNEMYSIPQGISDAILLNAAVVFEETSPSYSVAHAHFLDIAQTSLAGVHVVDATFDIRDLATYLNFPTIIFTKQCLDCFTVDESTMNDIFDHGVDSLSLREDPKSWSVVVFAHPTSPFVYRSSAIDGGLLSIGSLALPVDIGRDGVDGSGQHNITWKIYMAFGLALIALLSLLLSHLQYTVTSPPTPGPTLRYVPYDLLPNFSRLQEQRLDTPFEYRFSGCKCDRYIEVWYSKDTMDSVNTFLANGCHSTPEQRGQEFWTAVSFMLAILSVIVELTECLVVLLYLLRSYRAQFEGDLVWKFKIIALLLLLSGALRYFGPLALFQRFLQVKHRRMKNGHRPEQQDFWTRLSSLLDILLVTVELMECLVVLRFFLARFYFGQLTRNFIWISKTIAVLALLRAALRYFAPLALLQRYLKVKHSRRKKGRRRHGIRMRLALGVGPERLHIPYVGQIHPSPLGD